MIANLTVKRNTQYSSKYLSESIFNHKVNQVKLSSIQRQWWMGIMFFLPIVVLFPLEFYGKIIERGIGNYLKWQNDARPQFGRVWDKDRQAILAQTKVQSIRSLLDSKQESAEAIDSLKALFENTEPSFPLVLSRKKFSRFELSFHA